MINSQCIAQVTFLSSNKGGKPLPFGNGFSPKLQFDGSPKEFFTELVIDNDVILYPGDQLKIQILIKGDPGVSFHAGSSFNLIQSDYTIGTGIIMKTL